MLRPISVRQTLSGPRWLLPSTRVAFFHQYAISSKSADYMQLPFSNLLKAKLSIRPVLCPTSHSSQCASLHQEVTPKYTPPLEPKKDPNQPDVELDLDCDEVRRRIKNLVSSGEFTHRGFQRNLAAVRPLEYETLMDFMRRKGPMNGAQSEAFYLALEYFEERKKYEMAGWKPRKFEIPRKHKLGPIKLRPPHVPISHISLDGEADDNVPIYWNTTTIKTRIVKYLKRPGVTKEKLLQDLSAQYHTKSIKLTPSDLEAFLLPGPPGLGYLAGNTSPIFYAACLFFEKTRYRWRVLSDAMPKIFGPSGGVNLKTPPEKWLGKLPPGAKVVFNAYGLATVYDEEGVKLETYGPPGCPPDPEGRWTVPDKFYVYD